MNTENIFDDQGCWEEPIWLNETQKEALTKLGIYSLETLEDVKEEHNLVWNVRQQKFIECHCDSIYCESLMTPLLMKQLLGHQPFHDKFVLGLRCKETMYCHLVQNGFTPDLDDSETSDTDTQSPEPEQ